MKTTLCLLAVLGLLPIARGAEAVGPFKFGIFAPEVKGQSGRVAEETLTLPLKLEATGFRWGVEYTPPPTRRTRSAS